MAFRTALALRDLIVLATLLACLIPTLAHAQPQGVILITGGEHEDDPYNTAARIGAELAARQAGVQFELVDPYQAGWSPENWGQRLSEFAAAGREPIITMGLFGAAIEEAADAHPDHAFAAIDEEIDAPNVISLLFRAEEGSFLVGALAAFTSKSGRIGFVGGAQAPVIDAFLCGYAQGARHVRSDIAVDFAFVGRGAAAFGQPERGRALAEGMIETGADVIFHAAGRSGNGVIDAAAAAGRHAIGVDVDQNARAPGIVLTSMVKRVDIAILHAVERFAAGERGGVVKLGLKDRGVDWVYNESNWDVVPQSTFDAIEDLKQQIVFGDIAVSPGPLGAAGCVL